MGQLTFYKRGFCRERSPKTMRLLKLFRTSRSTLRVLGGGEPWRKGMREKETPQEWQSAEQNPGRGIKVRADRQSRRARLAFSLLELFSVAHLMISDGCEMQALCVR